MRVLVINTTHSIYYFKQTAEDWKHTDYHNNNRDDIFSAVIMASQCKTSPGSFDECRLSAAWLPTLRPSQPIWTVSPPEMAATICINHHYLLLLSPRADTHFTVPRRVEG